MIIWCISYIAGDAALAREKILSIFHHCANVHSFPAFPVFKKCLHADITEQTPWMKAGLPNGALTPDLADF